MDTTLNRGIGAIGKADLSNPPLGPWQFRLAGKAVFIDCLSCPYHSGTTCHF